MSSRQRDPLGISYAAIRAFIFSDRWREGDKLNLVQLASELRISPTPVREAVSRLVGEDLIDYRPSQGYFVPQLRASQIEDLLWLWETSTLHAFDKLDGRARTEVLTQRYQAPIEMIDAVLGTSDNAVIVRTADLARARLHGVMRVEHSVVDLESERIAAVSARSVSERRKVMTCYFRVRRRSAAKLRNALEREDERRKQISKI